MPKKHFEKTVLQGSEDLKVADSKSALQQRRERAAERAQAQDQEKEKPTTKPTASPTRAAAPMKAEETEAPEEEEEEDEEVQARELQEAKERRRADQQREQREREREREREKEATRSETLAEEVELIKAKLKLEEHVEGGYFALTYSSPVLMRSGHDLPSRFGGDEERKGGKPVIRPTSSCIYFMLTRDSPRSMLHRLAADEIFHFYAGQPFMAVTLDPEDGSVRETVVGSDVLAGQVPQLLFPAGTWFGAFLLPGSEYALFGCTVSPAFDFHDFDLASRSELIKQFPNAVKQIKMLTREEEATSSASPSRVMAAPAAASSSSSSSSSSTASSRNRSAAPASTQSQQTASPQQAPAPAPAAGMRSGGERPPSSLRVAAGRRNQESSEFALRPMSSRANPIVSTSDAPKARESQQQASPARAESQAQPRAASALGMAPGPWRCTCGYSNKSSRDTCFRCKAMRPE